LVGQLNIELADQYCLPRANTNEQFDRHKLV